jgi:hypothetical protein
VLAKIVNETIQAGLRREAEGEVWSERRLVAAQQLYIRGDKSGVPVLKESLGADKSEAVRTLAAVLLAKDRDPVAFKVLCEIATATTSHWGNEACVALETRLWQIFRLPGVTFWRKDIVDVAAHTESEKHG